MIKRNLYQLEELSLNHGVKGIKKVMFSYKDMDNPCRQFSFAKFSAGDHCDVHTHPTIDEHFLWIKGSGYFIVGGERIEYNEGDYFYIPAGTPHEYTVIEGSECYSIGVAVE